MAKVKKRKPSPGDDWIRVTADRPCPVCNGSKNCSVSKYATRAWCGRVESKSPPNGGGQWLHTLNAEQRQAWLKQRVKKKPLPQKDWGAKAKEFSVRAAEGDWLDSLAEILEVETLVLESLGVGWNGKAWTFPERDGVGNVVGINCRSPNGEKRQLPGGERGLTYVGNWADADGPIYVVEGGSDVAAGLSAELSVVGRPSVRGGINHLVKLFRDVPADREIIVVGENDKKSDGRWPGQEGAIATAKMLADELTRPIGWTMPPDDVKDLREWYADEESLPIEDWPVNFEEPTESEKTAQNQASQLVNWVLETGAELFHSPDEDAFITLSMNNHRETHRLRGECFQGWLRKLG